MESQLYKCDICGNLVTKVHNGKGTLVCCNKEMKELPVIQAKTEGKEKHIPVITIDGNKVDVNVGTIDHPMEEDHSIGFIQLLQNDKVVAEKILYPGQKPHATFFLEDTTNLKAREYCNLHGFWESN